MRKPLFLFAFANDKSKSLRLELEENDLREIFTPLQIQEKIQFLSLRGVSLDNIYKTFHNYHNKIALFHYSGHSDETFLHLTDTGARSENLSKVIGMQKNLKLVFLNGCSNEAQVKDLFYNGVKAVIATKAKIEDKTALYFSEQFYRAFVGGKNLKESFEAASGYIKDKATGKGINHRSIGYEEEVTVSNSEWVLLTSEDAHLTWCKEDLQEPLKIKNEFKKVEILIDVNKDLVELAFEGLSKYKPLNKGLWNEYKANPGFENFNNLQGAMLASYPSSLSIQLGDLFTTDASIEGRLRLIELNEAYLTLMKLLSSICLADLWNTILDHKLTEEPSPFIIREEYKTDIANFLLSSSNENAYYDFGWLIGTISRIFKENDKKPFIEEFENIFNSFINCDEIYEAYSFLEQELRTRIAGNNITDDEVIDTCLESERQLGILLRKCGFLSSYQLVAVKDIEVVKPNRVEKAKFSHITRMLNGKDVNIQREVNIKRPKYTSNNSILITKNFSNSDPPLNLSPFIIDENAYKLKYDRLPKIYFFKGLGNNEDMHFELAETLREELIISKKIDTKKYKPGIANIKLQMEMLIEHLGI